MKKFITTVICAALLVGIVAMSLLVVGGIKVQAHVLTSPPGGCWQDNCDGKLPLNINPGCGTPARTQQDVAVYEPIFGDYVGTLRMWQTGASGSGCMDIWSTFDSNGTANTIDSMDIFIQRFENTGGNDGAINETQCGTFFGKANCQPGNNDVAVLGYEGHNEDCFQASINVIADGYPHDQNTYADAKICKA